MLIVTLLALACAGAAADSAGLQSLRSWLAESSEHATYRSVENDLVAIFEEADSLNLPTSLLIDRLNLGAARRLPPQELVRGARLELVRLRTASEVIARSERSTSVRSLFDGVSRASLLNTISIYLSGGLSPDLMVAFLTEGARAQRKLDGLFRGCAVLLQVSLVDHFTDEELLRLGTALVASEVAPPGYAAIGSFIVRTVATGGGGRGVLSTVEQILRQGGGLPQMELQLGRRR